MAVHQPPPAHAIVRTLATGTPTRRVRLSVGGCGVFFAGAALWIGIALALIPEPSALIWIIPLSLAIGGALTIIFTRWGAASMMQFVADRGGSIRVVMGRRGVIRMANRIGGRHYFLRDFLLGGLIVLAGVAVAVVLGLIGSGRDVALGVFVLPLIWLFLASGIFMILAAARIHTTDIALEGTTVAPLAAYYLRAGGTPDNLSRGVPADRLLRDISDADLAQAASVAQLLVRVRNQF